jgi:hypothetical protein
MDLSQYRLETLHQDGEFILYRGLRRTQAEKSPPSILALSPVMERPAPATIKKMEHEFSLIELVFRDFLLKVNEKRAVGRQICSSLVNSPIEPLTGLKCIRLRIPFNELDPF